MECNCERLNGSSRGRGQTYREARVYGQSFDSRDGSFVTVRIASTFSKLSWPSTCRASLHQDDRNYASVFRFYAPLLHSVTVHFVRSIPYYDRNMITDDNFLLSSTVSVYYAPMHIYGQIVHAHMYIHVHVLCALPPSIDVLCLSSCWTCNESVHSKHSWTTPVYTYMYTCMYSVHDEKA